MSHASTITRLDTIAVLRPWPELKATLTATPNGWEGFTRFPPGAASHKGYAHGGAVSALLDEAGALAAHQVLRIPVVTTILRTRFIAPVPLEVPLNLQIAVSKHETNLVQLDIELSTSEMVAHATAIFRPLPPQEDQ